MAVISHLFASHIATQHKYESQGLALSKRHQVETSNKSRSKAALPYPRSLIDKSFEVMPNVKVKSLYLMISQRRPERKVRKFPQWEKLETRLWEICLRHYCLPEKRNCRIIFSILYALAEPGRRCSARVYLQIQRISSGYWKKWTSLWYTSRCIFTTSTYWRMAISLESNRDSSEALPTKPH